MIQRGASQPQNRGYVHHETSVTLVRCEKQYIDGEGRRGAQGYDKRHVYDNVSPEDVKRLL